MKPNPKTLRRAAERRAAVLEQMRALGGGVAVLFTAPEVLRNGDAHYDYRADSSFDYLTAFTEPEAALVLVAAPPGRGKGFGPKADRTVLLCRVKDAEREIWDGFRWGPEAARKVFGFDEAYPIDDIDRLVPQWLADQPAIHYAMGSDEALDARVRGWLGQIRAKARTGVAPPPAAYDLDARLQEMRVIKDAVELDTMRKAARISAQAHRRAMQATRPGMKEYEIEAELLYEFRRRGAQAPAYGSIVAGGANACVLHYRANDATLRDGELLLIDAGCELDGYASDITRTYPVGGRFSGPQRALYEIVLAAQQAAIDATRPGRTFVQPHDAATRVIVRGLIDCGLIAGTVDGALESGTYRRFYMHRTGHWLGRDVHDVGLYRAPVTETERARRLARAAAAPRRSSAAKRSSGSAAAGAPDGNGNGNGSAPAAQTGGGRRRKTATAGPPSRVLQPGMVITVEPGIYVRAANDVDPRWHDIGIRIEDDVVVRNGPCEIITKDTPKTVDDIEAVMKQGLKAARAKGRRRAR